MCRSLFPKGARDKVKKAFQWPIIIIIGKSLDFFLLPTVFSARGRGCGRGALREDGAALGAVAAPISASPSFPRMDL